MKVHWRKGLFFFYDFHFMQEFDHLTCLQKPLILMEVNLVSGVTLTTFVDNSDSFSIHEQNHVQVIITGSLCVSEMGFHCLQQ